MWTKITNFFSGSETILWARLQMLIGILMATDLSPVLPADWLPFYVIVAGAITEMMRRSRADDMRALPGTGSG